MCKDRQGSKRKDSQAHATRVAHAPPQRESGYRSAPPPMRAAAFRLLRGACCATLLVWGCVGRDGTVSGAPAPRGRNRVRRLDVVLLHIVPEEIAQIDRLHDLERRLEVTPPPVVAEQRPDGIHAEGAGDWWCRWSVRPVLGPVTLYQGTVSSCQLPAGSCRATSGWHTRRGRR